MASTKRLPPQEAEAILTLAARAILARRASMPDPDAWRATARPEQIPPAGDWRTWYIRGGRGGGKTWTGSNTLAEWARDNPGLEFAVVAPTYADARDTCVEGPSGLLAAFNTTRAEVDRGKSPIVASWNRSLHDMRLRNGATIWADGADDGAPTIQGKNLAALWADEIGLWKKWQMAWEEAIRYAVRIAPAKIIATGTPKRAHPLVRELMGDEDVVKSLVKTIDNRDNLDPGLVDYLIKRYGGTTLGRQELEGEMLEDVPGALVRRIWIDDHRWSADRLPDLHRIVVGVDPEASSAEGAAETGIIAAGAFKHEADEHDDKDHDHYIVLDDVSVRATPAGWGKAATTLYQTLTADLIVGEVNNGGEMVEHVIRTADSRVNYKAVTASRGKRTRAEPISALYERGMVHHAGAFADLEDQWASWVPDGKQASPDRLDAAVWALTELTGSGAPGVLGFYRSSVEEKRKAET